MKKIILCLILKLSKIKINNVIPKKALIVFDLSPVKIIDPKKISKDILDINGLGHSAGIYSNNKK